MTLSINDIQHNAFSVIMLNVVMLNVVVVSVVAPSQFISRRKATEKYIQEQKTRQLTAMQNILRS
jgi:hypothetical protein